MLNHNSNTITYVKGIPVMTTKVRGFERWKSDDVKLPERSTSKSAGYDLFMPTDFTIQPSEVALVPMGVRAYMQDDEVLMLYDRSSNFRKKGIVLINSVGIIDADYYGNADNGGLIYAQFRNMTSEPVTLQKGEAVMQGIFQKYLVADDDNATGIRAGGIGSTGN